MKPKKKALTDKQIALLREVADAGTDGLYVWSKEKSERRTLYAFEKLDLVAPSNIRETSLAITDDGRAMLEAPRSPLCAGCDKPLPKRPYGGLAGHEVEVAPEVKVRICSGRSSSYPSDACKLKAVLRARRCPGCGAEDTAAGSICQDCRNNVERGRTLATRDVEWWAIVPDGLGPYLKEELPDDYHGRRPIEDLARHLVEALATGRTAEGYEYNMSVSQEHVLPREGHFRRDGRKVCVELTPEQGQAASKLVQEIRHCLWLAYKTGFETGDNALTRLANGDTTVRDYERSTENMRKNISDNTDSDK